MSVQMKVAVEMTGMSDGGDYATNSLSQQACCRLLHSYAKEALAKAGISKRRVTLVDYGAADGLASSQLLGSLPPEWLKSLDCTLQDLPGNDWEAAAKIMKPWGSLELGIDIKEQIASAPPAGTVLRLLVAPGSFYGPALPEASVDVSISSIAYHWLSDTQTLPPLGSTDVSNPNVDPTARKEWQAHGDMLFKKLLQEQAAAIRPGGTFAAVIPSTHSGNGRHCYDVTLKVLDELLGKRGMIFTVPAYQRTLEEVRAGFAAMPDLKLHTLEEHTLKCPYWRAEELSSLEGRLAFAERFVASVYAWASKMLATVAKSDGEMSILKAELTEAIALHVEQLEDDNYVILMVATKANE